MNLTSKKMLEELKTMSANVNSPFIKKFLQLVVMSSVGVMASDGEIEEPELEMYRTACKMLELDVFSINELEEFIHQKNMRDFLQVGLLKVLFQLMESDLNLQSINSLITVATGYLASVAQADNQIEAEEIEFISPFLEIHRMTAEVSN